MNVIFETAAGQRLEGELVGDELKKLVDRVTGICQMVRSWSVRDVNVAQTVQDHFAGLELVVRERQTRS